MSKRRGRNREQAPAVSDEQVLSALDPNGAAMRYQEIVAGIEISLGLSPRALYTEISPVLQRMRCSRLVDLVKGSGWRLVSPATRPQCDGSVASVRKPRTSEQAEAVAIAVTLDKEWRAAGPHGRTKRLQRTGALRELIVAADLMARGYDVFRNLAPNGVDLVADIRGSLVRVEVKSGTAKEDGSVSRINTSGPHDMLAVVLRDGSIAYFGTKP